MADISCEKYNKNLKFRPTVLVASSLDQCGENLLDEAHMEGLVMQKCIKRDINYSNAFMVATKKESEDVTEKYYKIQDNVFFRAFATICKNNHFCDKDRCKKNDATAAEFVMEQGIKEEPSYKGMKNIYPVQNKENSRRGIRYICPNTKLDEIAFPVKLYDREMGVLIVGQISTIENRQELETYIKEKLSEYPDEGDADSVIGKIKIEDEANLGKLIDKIADTVGDIEEGLIDSYKERQNQYVFEKSNELIENMRKELNEKTDTNESVEVYPAAEYKERYIFVGECIKRQLEALCQDIGISKGKVFLPNFDNLVNNQYGTIQGDGNSVFYFEKWKKSEEDICENIRDYIEGNENEFDLLLVADSATYPIALAVFRNDFLVGITEEESHLLQETFSETFRKFAEYAQMTGMEAKSDYYRVYLDSYMSIQRHELGQSNAGYQMLIEEFKKQRNKFLKQIYETSSINRSKVMIEDYIRYCDSFIRDSESYLNTTMIRIQSTKYLIDFSEMEKTYFYPYEQFLFKWNHIYKAKAEKEHLQFHCPVVSNFDVTRPRMYGDPLMIEQAAYNLTNNAIKYAIPGTQVSLDCRLNQEKNRYEIIVENLGMPLKYEDEKDKIFEFGKRGSNNKKEGSGLGLFLTRQIAKAHGGDVCCKIEKLSEYNWALVELYIQYYKDKSIRNLCKNKEVYECLEKESEENRSKISKIIVKHIPDNAFTPMYVNQNILRGTAQFTFIFWIPYQK